MKAYPAGCSALIGSGITPMYQMISHSLSLPEDKTKWTLIFANVTEKDIRTFRRPLLSVTCI